VLHYEIHFGNVVRPSNEKEGKIMVGGSKERGEGGIILKRVFQNAKKFFFQNSMLKHYIRYSLRKSEEFIFDHFSNSNNICCVHPIALFLSSK